MPPTPQLGRADLARTLDNPAEFARILTSEPLWPHQVEVALSPARYRVLCAGRQAGKSRLLAVLALHKAYTQPGSRTLIVSAGEDASKRVLAEVAALATGSPMLAGSVVDENKGSLTLSSGSVVMSVPASQRQVRGWAIDLLIGDEAGFWPQELWQAAEPVIIARPGSRVVLCSTPWGAGEHFFRKLWQRGMDHPDEQVAAWHWPSSISPLVDQGLLAGIEERETPDYFAREYLADWTDEAGQYFTEAELAGAVADYEMLSPEYVAAQNPWDSFEKAHVRRWPAACGLDWGFSVDAHALCLLSVLDDRGLNDQRVFFVPWLERHFRMEYSAMVNRVAEVASAYQLYVIASEINGVGAAPTQDLQHLVLKRGTGSHVRPVWTDIRRKMSGFSKVKGMLQRGALVLPRHPDLLSELRGLQFETTPSGMTRIAAAGHGHDDLAMSLMQAASCLRTAENPDKSFWAAADFKHVTTSRGVRVPVRPVPLEDHYGSFIAPEGAERSAENAW